MTGGISRSSLMPALVLLLALGILGVMVEEGSRHLRGVLRAQMVDRDGEILYAVAQARHFSGSTTNLARRLSDPVEQLDLALEISQIMDGVVGVRLYDSRGRFVTAFSPAVKEAELAPETLRELRELRPSSRYEPSADIADVIWTEPSSDGGATNRVPLLEVNIPIHAPGEAQLLGSAQLIIDAHDLRDQTAKLDSQLALQALGEFLAGGALLTWALIWGYRRLRRANQLLEERTSRLLRANHELTLAAKTGALGAVTAHLIHGLSNPLANLQDFMASMGRGNPAGDDLEDAMAATRRMRELVHEVVRVLGEATGSDQYEISLRELSGVLDKKVNGPARDFGVACEISVTSRGRVSNHQANILLLILENLVHNALKVTPRGKRARVSISDDASGGVACDVSDEGPGFPEHLAKNPFLPCRSTRGGAGLGLAISNRLAIHLGGELELKQTGPAGSIVRLRLPPAALAGEERADSAASRESSGAGAGWAAARKA